MIAIDSHIWREIHCKTFRTIMFGYLQYISGCNPYINYISAGFWSLLPWGVQHHIIFVTKRCALNNLRFKMTTKKHTSFLAAFLCPSPFHDPRHIANLLVAMCPDRGKLTTGDSSWQQGSVGRYHVYLYKCLEPQTTCCPFFQGRIC